MISKPMMEDRQTGMWIDVDSPIPREKHTMCNRRGKKHRYKYRKPFCSECGAKMIGERKQTTTYRDEYLYG